MNINEMIKPMLSAEETASVVSEIETALTEEYQRGLQEGRSMLEEYKFKLALSEALSKTDAKNPEVLKALIDFSAISNEDGEIRGLSEQIQKLKRENPFLFEDRTAPRFTRKPKSAAQISKKDFDLMSYSERTRLFAKNPALYKSLKG